MTIDPFFFLAPLNTDPELKTFLEGVARTLRDLTSLRGTEIVDVPVTEIVSATVIEDTGVSVDLSTSVTNLDAKIDEVIARQVLLETAINAILAQKRIDGDINE